MSADEYFDAEGVSNSMLTVIHDGTPAHLPVYLNQDREVTKAMEIGTFTHDLLLLQNAPQNIAVKPEGMKLNTKEGIAWKAEQAGKTILSKAEYDSIYGMRDSVMRNPKIRYALETGFAEQPLFSPFSLGGTVMRKGRLDLLSDPNWANIIFDFKTTTDASPKAFARDIVNRGYHRQAAYYLDLAKENNMPHSEFIFVAVEKKPPYLVALYQVDLQGIQRGRKAYIDLLQIYIQCQTSGIWPGWGDEPQILTLPNWDN